VWFLYNEQKGSIRREALGERQELFLEGIGNRDLKIPVFDPLYILQPTTG
jgi:hypothetical protein